jgi:Phage integrase, N-terminal SAM-like domain
MPRRVPIRLEDLLSSFRRQLRALAKAPRTIELYSQSVRSFSRWLIDRGREPMLDELTRHALAAWPAELAATAEPSTVAARLRGMRRFCRWLVAQGEGLRHWQGFPSPRGAPFGGKTAQALDRYLRVTAICGCGRCIPTPVPGGCCSASAAR